MKEYPAEFRPVLLELGARLCSGLEKFNVQYIMCGGTLLGAVREGGLIKHDYDLDFSVFPNSRKQFFDFVKHAQKHPECGLKVTLQLPIVVKFSPIVPRHISKAVGFNRKDVPNPTADVFMLEPRRGGGFKIVGNQWPKWYWKRGEVFPLQRLSFNGMMWPAPSKPEKMLERYYGEWKTPVFYEWPTPH
jgi:hypothetical protein